MDRAPLWDPDSGFSCVTWHLCSRLILFPVLVCSITSSYLTCPELLIRAPILRVSPPPCVFTAVCHSLVVASSCRGELVVALSVLPRKFDFHHLARHLAYLRLDPQPFTYFALWLGEAVVGLRSCGCKTSPHHHPSATVPKHLHSGWWMFSTVELIENSIKSILKLSDAGLISLRWLYFCHCV